MDFDKSSCNYLDFATSQASYTVSFADGDVVFGHGGSPKANIVIVSKNCKSKP